MGSLQAAMEKFGSLAAQLFCLLLGWAVSIQGVTIEDYNPDRAANKDGVSHADVEINGYDARYGTYIGLFNTLFHDVVGDVYAIDNTTILIRGFSYDGEAPDAHFFAGNRTPKPSSRGFTIPNEDGRKGVLGPFSNKHLVLKFPITK